MASIAGRRGVCVGEEGVSKDPKREQVVLVPRGGFTRRMRRGTGVSLPAAGYRIRS